MPKKGYKQTPEHIAKSHTPEANAKRGWPKGKKRGPQTPEHKANRAATRIGTHLSEKTIAKMVIAKTGTNHPMWNKHHSEETIAKMRASHIGKKFSQDHISNLSTSHIGLMKGPQNPAWQGGISFELYPQDFDSILKEQIRKRDNYTCQKCGRLQINCEKALSVHHIDYNKKNCNPMNLLALCQSCNAKVNKNREYWTKQFRKKLS